MCRTTKNWNKYSRYVRLINEHRGLCFWFSETQFRLLSKEDQKYAILQMWYLSIHQG